MVIDSNRYLLVPLLENNESNDEAKDKLTEITAEYDLFIYYTNEINKILVSLNNGNIIQLNILKEFFNNISTLFNIIKKLYNIILIQINKDSCQKINLIISNIQDNIKNIDSKYHKIINNYTDDKTNSISNTDEYKLIENEINNINQFIKNAKYKISIEILKVEGQPILFNKKEPKIKSLAQITMDISDNDVILSKECFYGLCSFLILMVICAISLMKIFSRN